MSVKELIECLGKCKPEAKVKVAVGFDSKYVKEVEHCPCDDPACILKDEIIIS